MRYSLELREMIELLALCAEVRSTTKQLYSSKVPRLESVNLRNLTLSSAQTSQKVLFLPP